MTCVVDGVSDRVLAAKKGYASGQRVECFVVLSALGGERGEDFALLQQDLGLADDFRDCNVPAGHGIKELVDRAYEALPAGDGQGKVRSDSAATSASLTPTASHGLPQVWPAAISTPGNRPADAQERAPIPQAL